MVLYSDEYPGNDYPPGDPPPTVPDEPVVNKDCGEGYEWEADPTGQNPNGRCKVAGTNFDDGCWIDSDGQVYCRNNPKPQSNSGSSTTTNTTNNGGGGGRSGGGPDLNAILNQYKALYGNTNVAKPYDEAAIARLEGKLKSNAESAKANQKNSYMARRSASGLGNTGRTDQGFRNIDAGYDQSVSEGSIQINDMAIKANIQVEIQNVERNIALLNSTAQFALAMAQDANQKQSIQNNWAMQNMQLQQQLEMFKLQLIFGNTY